MLYLLACIENNVGSAKDDPSGFDTGDPPDLPGEDTSDTAPVEETCNGTDDDGDGEVDEGFSDIDADGTADCVDDTCVTTVPGPRSDYDATCEGVDPGAPPANPWSVEVEWHYGAGSVLDTPTVGDLDLDGVPEVVFDDDGGGGGQMVVLDGASGSVEWTMPGMAPWGGNALGDIDGDGLGDIVGTSGSCMGDHTAKAYDYAGNLLWSQPIGSTCEVYPTIADLDGDGDVEVLVNQWVLDGASGAVELELPLAAPTNNWGVPSAADLDGDGVMEILLGNTVYDVTGTELFSCGVAGQGTFTQPVNVDADTMGEVLVAGSDQMTLCDDDGTQLWTLSYGGYGSAIAVADFDSDGLQEFAFAKTSAVKLLDDDGSEMWSTRVTDSSGLAGCTSWDVNADGVPEVIYADEVNLMVLDGVTGSIVIQDSRHDSRTASETPSVADVDGDGHGEIIYASDAGAYEGVTAMGSADGDWPWAPMVYNQHTYYGANINEDLSVPTAPAAPWVSEANVFRGQPSVVYAAGLPNLRVAVTDLCVASCEAGGAVDAWVQVWNDGAADVTSAELTLYGLVDGVETLLDTRSVGPIPSAGSVEVEVTTTIDAMGSALVARIDATGAVSECDETDNEHDWVDTPCP